MNDPKANSFIDENEISFIVTAKERISTGCKSSNILNDLKGQNGDYPKVLDYAFSIKYIYLVLNFSNL